MSYIEERFKNIERAKKDPKLAEMIAKVADMPSPNPEPEYDIRPTKIAMFVSGYCRWVGQQWREANMRRDQEARDELLKAEALPA